MLGFGAFAGFAMGRGLGKMIEGPPAHPPRDLSPPDDPSQPTLQIDKTLAPRLLRDIRNGVIGSAAGVTAIHAAFLYRDRNLPPTPDELEPLLQTLEAHITRELGPQAPTRHR